MLNYNSIYINLAGTTVNWLDNDHPLWYENNLNENKDILLANDWIDKKITYSINKHGFRCENFTEQPSILFLGCSHTVGIGLGLESLWAHIVAENLKLRYYNLGQSGGSNDTAYRLGSYWIPKIKPKIVLLLQPAVSRTEIITADNEIYFLLVNQPNTDIIYKKQWHHYYNDWSMNETNLELNREKNKLALENICFKNQTKFITVSVDEFPKLDLARDLLHYGKKSNKMFSEKILNSNYF